MDVPGDAAPQADSDDAEKRCDKPAIASDGTTYRRPQQPATQPSESRYSREQEITALSETVIAVSATERNRNPSTVTAESVLWPLYQFEVLSNRGS